MVVGLGALAVALGAVVLARWQYFGPERRSSPVVLRVMLVSGGVAIAAVALTAALAGDC